MTERNPIKRFYALDALRGLAALGVVLFHYRMFDAGRPLEKTFLFIHVYGWMMVDVFFCISGFIFFWKYGELIYQKSIGFKKFALLRLSRLYPLHLLTLLLVVGGQLLVHLAEGNYFFEKSLKLPYLLPDLLFVSTWIPN